MAEVREFVIGFVGTIIGLVVAVALIPVIGTTITAANITDPTQKTMLGLIPLLVAVGVLLFAVKALF